MLRSAIVLAILAFALPQPAAAQSSRSVLTAFGFLGEWSPDCGKPAGPTNTRRKVTLERRAVRFEEDLGPDYVPNAYRVLDARRIAKDKVAMRVELNGESVQELTIVKEDGRLRTLTTIGREGKPLVRDGTVLASGRPTPWLQKCR